MIKKSSVDGLMEYFSLFKELAVKVYNETSSREEFIYRIEQDMEVIKTTLLEEAARNEELKFPFKPPTPGYFYLNHYRVIHRNECKYGPKRVFKDDEEWLSPEYWSSGPTGKDYPTYEDAKYAGGMKATPCKICKPDVMK